MSKILEEEEKYLHKVLRIIAVCMHKRVIVVILFVCLSYSDFGDY